MVERVDIILTAENDLKIQNGDFLTGDANAHHAEILLISAPGSFKQYPLTGANLRSLINGKVDVSARRDLKVQLVSDGFSPKSITITDGILNVQL